MLLHKLKRQFTVSARKPISPLLTLRACNENKGGLIKRWSSVETWKDYTFWNILHNKASLVFLNLRADVNITSKVLNTVINLKKVCSFWFQLCQQIYGSSCAATSDLLFYDWMILSWWYLVIVMSENCVKMLITIVQNRNSWNSLFCPTSSPKKKKNLYLLS